MVLCRGNDEDISDAMLQMGILTEKPDAKLRAKQGRDMFGTIGQIGDPFAEDSPLRQSAILEFPKQYFLILRVVQLIRGLAARMDIEHNTSKQWLPIAKRAVHQYERSLPEMPARPERVGKFYGI
jgi:hypothetical protein